MAVTRDYLLRKPERPSAPKFYFDTEVVPIAVNLAGALEVAIDRTARRAGVRPALVVGGVAGLLSLTMLGVLRRKRGQTTRG